MGQQNNLRMQLLLRTINQRLSVFALSTAIQPNIKESLLARYDDALSYLLFKMDENLDKPVPLINQLELDFVEQIQVVIRDGINRDQPLVLKAVDTLIIYLREKNALIDLNNAAPESE